MTPEEIEAQWREYRKTFGGGMVPFDNVFFDDGNSVLPEVERWARGVDAVMAVFIAFLKERANA